MNLQTSFPQGVITKLHGRCVVLPGNDIDTDRIIPARFLKCVSFKDLGEQIFADDRKELKGKHPFDLSHNQGASILIVNENFGCGSSREHAPQALMRWGIRALIGQSFAEIFYGNCLALGIPCATASPSEISNLQTAINNDNQPVWELDIQNQIFKNESNNFNVRIEPGPLKMFTTGNWDATMQLINKSDLLEERKKQLPYLNNFTHNI